MNVEVQSLDKYLSKSEEWMLKFVAREKQLSQVKYRDEFKKQLKEEKKSQWLEKPLHGRFLKDIEKVSTERTWQWLKGRHLKKEIEVMVCAAQEKTLRVNSIKYHIDGQDVSAMCRLCGESSETVMHLSSGCPVLAKSKYQIRHDIVGKHIHWLLLKKYEIPTGNKWYSHVPNVVTETDDGKVTIYWDKPIKTDRKVKYNRPDVVVIDREEEKIDKYMDLAVEVRRQFRVKTVIVPIYTNSDSPSKTIRIVRKIGNRRRNWKLTNCCIIINYIYLEGF